MLNKRFLAPAALVLILLRAFSVSACTNFLVTKGASKTGSVMITYAVDAHVIYGELYYTPAGKFIPGSMLDIYDWDSGRFLGKIAQVPETYSVVGNMNEHQLSIGETTFGGRPECTDPNGIVDYGSLIYITLQRASTAREAIKTMAELVAEYGYASSGESISIADKNEAWIFEIMAKDSSDKGAVWVARRIPDGYVSAHANQARIRTFPLANGKTSISSKDLDKIFNKKIETVYAEDVISFARGKGWFDGDDKDFSFVNAYAPVNFGSLRFCEARVWSFFNRVAPSLQIPSDYAGGNVHADPMPLWIKPDHKLTNHDMMMAMRDHYEGTPFDMTKDIGAGPYKLPYRFRPLTWEVDGQTYFNERATATQQTGWSFISEMRSWLPDPIGGIHWFGVDDAASTVYVPMYCGIRKAPWPYAVGNGSFNEFTWDAAFWVFNWVSNYAYLRYSEMIEDIHVVQSELEGQFLADTDGVDKAAMVLYNQSPRLAHEYLTEYSCKVSDQTIKRWRKLGEQLIFRYLDGNKKDELNKVRHPGYPKAWYREIAKQTGDHLKMQDGGH
ncbi:C69 family dipeptidase [bacterium]|nr:C69 family dipeptidase [bacterium]